MKEKLCVTEKSDNKIKTSCFPKIYRQTCDLKEFRSIELSPIKIKSFFCRNIKKKKKTYKIKSYTHKKLKDYETVKKLSLNYDIDDIIKENIQLIQSKESIDFNSEVKEKRLGFSRVESTNREISIDKVNDLEKIQKLEKEFKDLLKKLNKQKEYYTNINKEVSNIEKIIEEKNFELDVLDTDYYEHKMRKEEREKGEKIKQKIIEYENDGGNSPSRVQRMRDSITKSPNKRGSLANGGGFINSFSRRDSNFSKRRGSIEGEFPEDGIDRKQLKFEQMNKMLGLKQKKEEIKKKLKQEILDLKKESQATDLKRQKIKGKYKEIKKELYEKRRELIKYYHLHLYEGLDFRGEGLSTIIRTIWNLGVDVDKAFLPSYLDQGCIRFLFSRARQIIEISKIKQLIKDSKKDFIDELQQWKDNEEKVSKIVESKKILDIQNNPYPKDTALFKTKIEERDKYKEDYPHSTFFMNSYERRLNSNPDNIEMKKVTEVSMKNEMLPVRILDKNMSIDNLKNLLKVKVNKLIQTDKNEVQRLTKEFLYNNYENKYKVIIETLFAALFGEGGKNEQLNYFSKLEKDYHEKQRLIKFHALYKAKNFFQINKSPEKKIELFNSNEK